ncbi:tail fiber domain-containing protein, partial [uncultured Flavobacterium sp.]|uniref:tail fiber domain-containing protein n=1 Tax=uncultured Flavobacterium sp. TaxID=165435 RepID=UPI0025F29208
GATTRFVVQNSGNVGIGTTNPGAKLEVNGAVKITDGSQAAGKVLTSDANGLASWQTVAVASTADGSETKVQAGTNMNVTGSGTTVAPYVVNATNLYTNNGTLSGGRTVTMGANNLQFNATTGKFILNTAAGSQAFTQTGAGIFGIDAPNVSNGRFVVLENGNVGIGTASPSTLLHVNGVITATKIQGPSDSRFKKNIKPIENALEKVMQLGGYTYDWKEAKDFPGQTLGKGHDMGVIAQEVEKQFPEAVSTNADGFKAVSYTELVPALIEAIKAQQAEIETLKVAVAKLKK